MRLTLLLLPYVSLSAATVFNYLPFGDSITDYGCWRPQLAASLQKNHNITLNFIGTRRAQATCLGGIEYDRDHEGHPGHQAVDISNQNMLPRWLAEVPETPNIVTIHLGTVDVIRGPVNRTPKEILDAVAVLIAQFRRRWPLVRILVAQIIPLPPPYAARVQALNNAIPAWAATQNRTDSPVWVVDQWTGFSAQIDLYDGIHPSQSGDDKIAKRWEEPIVGAMRNLEEALASANI